MIQPESLPDGFSKSPEAGPGYDLHDDGTVARLYCRVDGEIRGWVVELEKGQCRGTAQRVRADQVNFPEDYDEDEEAPAAEADEDSSALFAEWVTGYADDVVREVDADQFLTCAFCKLRENEVETMIAGPEASICNECVAQCAAILTAEDEESGDQPTEEASAD
jgi:hypothetical protein